MLTIFLAILTVIWYILIFIYAWSSNTVDVKDTVKEKSNIEKQIDDFSDISEKDEIIPDWAWADYY